MKRATVRSSFRQVCGLLFTVGLCACASVGTAPPSGGEESASVEDKAAMTAIGQKVKGTIVWSSSRLGNHDLFTMNTDGTNVVPITKGDTVDWFPRFSPDGGRILFCRSKKGWVREQDANVTGKWDVWTVKPDGRAEKKIVENASWATWVSDDEILFVRSTIIFRKNLNSGDETEIVDSTKVDSLDSALLQQPQMSKDGHYIAITLRGSKRETGIWDIQKKTWTRTGDGCQVNWAPDGESIYWVHPTGNGGSRVVHEAMKAGKPTQDGADIDKMVLVDIPGRRSHEYFPQISADGKWLVWAATQRGHDHDIYDYEIYLWQIGAPEDQLARLTFHSANDRWPDIYLGDLGAKAAPVNQ